MASVFAGFILAPDTIIASIGFALAIGVLVDAFIVRMTLIPAVMTLLGKVAWYLPRWLDKVLPNVDIEGEKLLASLNAAAASEPVQADDARDDSGTSPTWRWPESRPSTEPVRTRPTTRYRRRFPPPAARALVGTVGTTA